MNYTKIDLSTWKRGTLFKFYIDKMRVVMSLSLIHISEPTRPY